MATNESEIKSIMSFSSRSESQEGSPTQRWRNVPLHERCNQEDMLKIREAFEQAYKNVMLPDEFRTLLRNLLNVEYDEEEYNILFMKINTNRNGEITWDEVVSHLLLGYFASDTEAQNEALQAPILGLPNVLRSQHRHPISRICFCPDVDKNRQADPLQGCYLTVSRDGMINWWSLDMSLLRTAYSSSPSLKVRTTWVTDMVCMPDVNIIVTSSTERDLRFYDCTAKTFTLKIVISSWEYMICSMYYHFNQSLEKPCMLVCGDVGGYVRVLTFSPVDRGPFRNEAGRALIMLRHRDLQRKPQLLPELHLIEPARAHNEWVRQVSYYSSLHCVVSCATCSDALLLSDFRSSGGGTHNMFRVQKGIQCFVFDEDVHVIVTGGPDTIVRVWSPFVPSKPSVIFEGHHTGITCLVMQNRGQKIYSLSRDRTIKVWDVQQQVCIQTYIDVPAVVGERTPISAVYNPATQELILAAIKIAVLVLDEQLNPKHTDGYTHARAVSQVLYNPLFKVIITCGLGSFIINWDPLAGTRNVVIRSAHTRLLHGELLPVEITAACFDPGYLLLLTGARNGTLKVWNFNTGACLRSMSIEHMCEVTNCFWVEGRILAVGWNRHVTEFEDAGAAESGKAWETRHSDDVLAAAIRPPLSLATATYNSEMILWKLETGQPYRQFSCTEPMLRIKMTYSKRSAGPPPQPGARALSAATRPSLVARAGKLGREGMDMSSALSKAKARRLSGVSLPAAARRMRHLAAHCALFLPTRPVHMAVASLFISLESGIVQGWSDHPAGGFQGSFQAIHTTGDYVSSFATDVNNEFLITCTTVGYVKVWLMTNYLSNEEKHINMPRLRLMFPFLLRDRVEGRAKRCVRDQPAPLLLNSFRGHLRCVTSVAYIDHYQLIVTQTRQLCGTKLSYGSYYGYHTANQGDYGNTQTRASIENGSSDYSARVWKLSGQYVGTLGGVAQYCPPAPRDPPDVRKVASSTTLKVWHGGEVSRYVPGQVPVDKLRDITEYELRHKTFGAAPRSPLLGHYFRLPRRAEPGPPPALDASLPTIPLYAHLRMAATQPVRRPPTPDLVRATRLKRSTDKERKAHFDAQREPARDKPAN